MYLLVGLGNPGSKYKKNRHNVGHMTIDIIVKKHGFKKKNKNKFGEVFEGKILNEKIFALKPKDFMNLSGAKEIYNKIINLPSSQSLVLK